MGLVNKEKKLYPNIFLYILLASLHMPIYVASAQTETDLVSSNIAPTGKSSQTRITITNASGSFNFSIPPTLQTKKFLSLLPICKDSIDSECIDSLEYRIVGESTWNKAMVSDHPIPSMAGITAITYTALGFTQSYGDVKKDLLVGVPRGATSTVWRLPGAKHLGGDEYLVNVAVTNMNDQIQDEQLEFKATISPIAWREQPRNFYYDKLFDSIIQYNFPRNLELKLIIRMGFLKDKVSSWYNGRIQNPSIEISDSELTLIGQPVWVPVAGTAYYGCSEMGQKKLQIMKELLGNNFESSTMCNDSTGSSFTLDVANTQAFEIFQEWENQIVEYGKNSSWSFGSSYPLTSCQENGLNGFVSSNALLYTPGPPIYNPIEKSLSYQIASTHLDKVGTINRGRFNLAIKSSTASCLWKIEPSSLNEANIQITYQDGTPIVGTHTIFSKNGWTYINIEDFTFSSRNFKISPAPIAKVGGSSEKANPAPLSQTESQVPKENSKLTPSLSKSATIYCVKGKLTKKVTGINPKCPSGYKKK